VCVCVCCLQCYQAAAALLLDMFGAQNSLQEVCVYHSHRACRVLCAVCAVLRSYSGGFVACNRSIEWKWFSAVVHSLVSSVCVCVCVCVLCAYRLYVYDGFFSQLLHI
jgi:hypothetical protein